MGSRILIYTLLFGVLILGGYLRLSRLCCAPPSVNWDEASYAYNALSLWQTGKDEYGTVLPLAIRSFDDYKPPIYAYLTAPIVGVFGLSEVTARLVSVVFGILTVFLVFLFTLRLINHHISALLAGLFVAISPIFVHFSRLAFEAVVALPLMLLGLLYFQKRKFICGLFFIMVSAFAYNSHKVYFGLALMYVLWYLRLRVFRLWNLVPISLILLPIVVTSLLTPALARFSGTSIFPLFKQTYSVYQFSGELVNRYMAYFSPTNIFVRGTNEPGQQVLDYAVFFPILVIFWAIGLWRILRYRHTNSMLIFWLLVSPIPAVLTWSWFTPVRILPFWIFLAITMSIGAKHFLTPGPRIVRICGGIIIACTLLVNTTWLHHRIQWQMPYLQYGWWQWGFREVVQYIDGEGLDEGVDSIVWETPQAQPYIFVLFYSKYSPNLYHTQLDSSLLSGKPRTVYDFGKYRFRKIYWPTDKQLNNVLFVGTTFSLPEHDIHPPYKILKDIIDPQGYVAYRIVGI